MWVVLPDRHQATAFRRRLAGSGGAIGARVGTFSDLYTEVLACAGLSLPVTPPAVVHRLAQAAIDAVAGRGHLMHYAPIQRRPGLTTALAALIAELKRARVDPADFAHAVRGRGARLEELGTLYAEYQQMLIALDWADPEGLGWLAVQVLQSTPSLPLQWRLLAADGFDSFNPTQLQALQLLSPRTEETLLTLTGTVDMSRQAHRRFERTLKQIQDALAPRIEPLASPTISPVAPLAHLQARLFEDAGPAVDAGDAVTFLEAQTIAHEAREALRWIKARILRDQLSPADCAIIAYDLSPYHPFFREAASEFGVPLRFAGGEPLGSNPAIAAILYLLDLSVRNWARRPMLDALRAPYFDLQPFGLGKQEAILLDQVAHWAQVLEGMDQWREAFDRLAESSPLPGSSAEGAAGQDDEEGPIPAPLPRGAPARQLGDCWAAFVERATPPERGSLEMFVEWVEDLISDDKGVGVARQADAQADTRPRDEAALAALRDVLRALLLGETVVGARREISYADFWSELRAGVETAEYKPDDSRPPLERCVYVANLNAARGVAYQAVAVIGLSEGLFPKPLAEDPFLSDEERSFLRDGGLPLEPRLRSDQRTLFYEAVTRASRFLLLTRPYLADDGETWEPSPYWTAALALFHARPRRVRPDDLPPISDAASKTELFSVAVRARALPGVYADLKPEWEGLRQSGAVVRARQARAASGEFEGDASALSARLADRFGPRHLWSSSRLETFGHCPFRFLIENGLGLQERKTPEAGYDASQLGSMLHAVLEKVYPAVPDPEDVEAVVAALGDVAQQVFDAAPRKYGFRPTRYWSAQREELIEKLAKTLRGLAEQAEGFRPARAEMPFGFHDSPPLAIPTRVGTVLFRGLIDRLDRNALGDWRIIDYKTGSSHLEPRDLAQGRRMQIVIYALAAQQVLKTGRVVDGFYWGILKGEAGSLRLSTFMYKDKEEREWCGMAGSIGLAQEYIGTYVEQIRRGQFPPSPPRDGCPDYCAAKSACWRYAPMDHHAHS